MGRITARVRPATCRRVTWPSASAAPPAATSESFYLSSWLKDDPDWGSYLPQLNGILATDAQDYYVFHPTNNTTFSVVNSEANTQITVNDTVASVTYAPPPVDPTTNGSGFWLLALKRTKLGNLFSCDTNTQPTPCGQFFNTGATDATQATEEANRLAAALSGASSEQLLFLVSRGADAPCAAAGCDSGSRRESRRRGGDAPEGSRRDSRTTTR